MKNAFTLIELLVVVLIIGILASIALPAYQTAVNKSRYAGLMPLAQSVKQAEEEMFMSKGDYTADLRDLSIQVPGTISQSGNTATVGDGTTVEVFSNGTQDFVKVSRENLPNTYVMYFNKSTNFAGGIHCEAAKSGDTVDKRAKQLCESLGGKQLEGTGTSADYVTYVLEGPTTGTGSGASSGGGGFTLGSISLSSDNLDAWQEAWESNCRSPWPGNLSWEVAEYPTCTDHCDSYEIPDEYYLAGEDGDNFYGMAKWSDGRITVQDGLYNSCISTDNGTSWECDH